MERVWYSVLVFFWGVLHSHIIIFCRLVTHQQERKGFACPICLKNYTLNRSFFTHLKRHGLNASIVKKGKLNELTTSSNKLDSDDEHDADEKEADESTDQHLVGEEKNDNEKTNNVGITPIPPSSLSLEVSSTTKLHRLTHRDVILTSTDSLTADKATQEDKMMLARLGRWVPVVYNHNNMQHGLLASSSIAPILLSKNQRTGTWCSPTDNDNHKQKTGPGSKSKFRKTMVFS